MRSRSSSAVASWVVLLAALVGATPAREARAQPTGPGPAFGSDAAEVGLAVASVGSLSFAFLPQRESDWAPSHEDDFDPWTSGVSDITGAYIGAILQLAIGYELEAAYLAAHDVDKPGVAALRTLAVEGEAAALTGGLTYALKKLTGRCRPRSSVGGVCAGGEFDAFPSGHTSPIGAMGGVRLVSVARTDVQDEAAGFRWASFFIAETTMVATGLLRVHSSSHSWEDVVVGGLLGHVAGVLVALAHPEEPLALSATSGPGARAHGASSRGAPPLSLGWSSAF